MDLRDLVKLAGIVNPELLNKIETTAEVEEADAAGFDKATTRPDEEVMDDPMATMGSDADLSLRRYLKARGDHVTVDENVYPDYTVEDVNEAYASFKEGKYKSDAQRKAVHAAKAEESVDEAAMSDEEKERAIRRAMQAADEPERGEKKKKVSLKKAPWEESINEEKEECRYCGGDCPNDEHHACDGYLGDIDGLYEASMGAPDYNPAAGKYADNIVERVVLGAEEGGIIVSVDGKPIGWAPTPEELADMLKSAGVDDNTDIMASSSVDFASEEEFENDDAAHEFIQNALEIMGIGESVSEVATADDEGMIIYVGDQKFEYADYTLSDAMNVVDEYADEMDGEEYKIYNAEGELVASGTVGDPQQMEADVEENAFNQAAADAARAGKDSFEFGGKTHKTTMKKDTAHKLDDDVDRIRKLAGLPVNEGGLKQAEIEVQEWAEKYNTKTGVNGDELANGWLQAMLNSGIMSDSYDQDEYIAFNEKYGYEDDMEWEEDDAMDKFYAESPITRSMHDEANAIMKKYGIDEADFNDILGHFESKNESINTEELTQADAKKAILELLVDIAKTSKQYKGQVTKDQVHYLGSLIHDFDALYGIETEKYSEIEKLFRTASKTNKADMSMIQPAYAQAKTLDEDTNEAYSAGDENEQGMVSNCCGAPIMDVYQGHGRCSDCKEMASAVAEESVTEGKLKDQMIDDMEKMSKEEFAKKYGKASADDMYESTESLDYVKKLAGL